MFAVGLDDERAMVLRRLDRHGDPNRRRFGKIMAAEPYGDDLSGVARHCGGHDE